ncbi:MAG TPA: pyridoxamine 5'-phosphate oxidase family protein [Acidimicrobiales bacterium]|nr:pyridoxamine 5'-phosphate oxidase family protein [Acidimicrobiales bacterium]
MADITWAYHAGSRAVQARAGVLDQADRNARGVGRHVPEVVAEFLADQPLVVVGGTDAAERVWCSLLAGSPGFARAPDAGTVEIDARFPDGDPLAGLGRAGGEPVGLLAIEPATRRRVRINGVARRTADGRLQVATDEVFGNCPKYITRRDVGPAARGRAGAIEAGAGATIGTALTPAQQAAVAAADTFFLATVGPDGGVDASHRGGEPGFVAVAADRLAWGDARGNAMFLSLGNLEDRPEAGVLVVDWRTGASLQVTGRAHVAWAAPDDRTVVLAVDEVREVAGYDARRRASS